MKSVCQRIVNRLGKWIFHSILKQEKADLCGMNNESNRKAWLKKVLGDIPAGYRILDAGAGELQFKSFCSHLKYVSQDFGKYNGSGDGKGLQLTTWNPPGLDIVSDITKIPEPDGSFDAVMCTEVFEHVPYPVEALTEFQRLLRPGGTLILTAPFCSLTHFSPYFYQTGYSRYFYEYWFERLGFDIKEITENGNYFEYLAQELHRLPQVGRNYSMSQPSLIERAAQKVLLRYLNRLSLHDKGSAELLAFGIHVLAVKKP
jgi:SAM-dependent methyltransferase